MLVLEPASVEELCTERASARAKLLGQILYDQTIWLTVELDRFQS